MSLSHVRRQYAVGQGFFHTGNIQVDGMSTSYVVDCGAMPMYAAAGDKSIDSYIGSMQGKLIDLLYLTHAHSDHINGVSRLLDPVRGLNVDTIVMPLLNVEDRLIAFARAALDSPLVTQNGFYVDFIIDPTAALSRFNPRQIIQVRPGKGNQGAPFSRGPTDPISPEGNQEIRLPEGLKVVGDGQIDVRRAAPGERTDSVLMDDTIGLIAPSPTRYGFWLLAPYLDASIVSEKSTFLKTLATLLGLEVSQLKRKLANKNFVAALVNLGSDALKTAYASVTHDLNITSLCLYSGPSMPLTSSDEVRYNGVMGETIFVNLPARRVGWMGTGDASLKDEKRRKRFFAHYKNHLESIVTFALPHHGSDHNFDGELIEKIQPLFYIAASDAYHDWRHPGTSVIQKVASAGRFVSNVTSSPRSRVREEVYWR